MAKKKPAYCALTSLTPPKFEMDNPNCSANFAGAVPLDHAVNKLNKPATTRTMVPNDLPMT
jgi:hypothetical protein